MKNKKLSTTITITISIVAADAEEMSGNCVAVLIKDE